MITYFNALQQVSDLTHNPRVACRFTQSLIKIANLHLNILVLVQISLCYNLTTCLQNCALGFQLLLLDFCVTVRKPSLPVFVPFWVLVLFMDNWTFIAHYSHVFWWSTVDLLDCCGPISRCTPTIKRIKWHHIDIGLRYIVTELYHKMWCMFQLAYIFKFIQKKCTYESLKMWGRMNPDTGIKICQINLGHLCLCGIWPNHLKCHLWGEKRGGN